MPDSSTAIETTCDGLQYFASAYCPILEMTNRCNMACAYCRNSTRKAPRGDMSLADVDAFLDNTEGFRLFTHADGRRRIELQGNGEPFVNRELYDVIDLLADNEIDIEIVTNGKWDLPADRLDSLLRVKHIRASVDAVDQEIYQIGKPKQQVAPILDKFRELVRLRNAAESQLEIFFRMNVFDFNQHHIAEYLKICREIGIDGVSLVRGGGNMLAGVTNFDPSAVAGFEDFVQLQTAQISCNKARRQELTGLQDILGKPELFGRFLEANQHLVSNRMFRQAQCNGMTVRWDGTLTVCCRDSIMSVSPGNAVKTPMRELLSRQSLDSLAEMIWLGLPKRMVGRKRKIACDHCPKFQGLAVAALRRFRAERKAPAAA